MIRLVRTIILVVGLVGATVSATPTGRCAYSNNRLPQHITPKNYDILLDVDTERHTYSGSLKTELKIEKDNPGLVKTNVIVLNMHRDVEIMAVSYFEVIIDLELGSSENQIKVNNICRDDENELLVLTLARSLAGQTRGKLVVTFEAKIRDDDTGIYRSNYTTQAGSDSYYVSTDFQPNKARRAFPCFDEPSFKATFDIKIRHDPARVALANTALLTGETRSGRKESVFKTTPMMSMHMVAFAIGEFEYIERTTLSGSPKIGAYTPVGKSQQAQFALDTAAEAFTYLVKYFSVPLPLDKIDMLTGVRHNGVRGNWGLIVCNETLLLFDDENSSPIYRGYIAQTVVRGLSQQWFGNLVTLKWWNDLWLQEGFNTWIGYNLTNHLNPKMQWEQHYLVESHQKALVLDSKEDAQHIRIADASRENIDSTFAELIGMKSTAIIKFLHDVYVGPEKFKKGIRLYLSEHRYRNAEASDLWEKLQIVSELPVDTFIKSWTEQSGHPLVVVQILSGSRKLLIEQKRDGLVSAAAANEQSHYAWIIPLTIVVSDGHRHLETREYTLDQQQQVMAMPDWFNPRQKNHWVKVNDDSRGFYHVQYSLTHLLPSLKRPILLKHLSTSNRIGHLDDYMSLYRYHLLTVSFPFTKLLHWYKDETEGVVLGQLAHALSLIPFPSHKVRDLKKNLITLPYAQIPLSSKRLQNAGTTNGMRLMDGYGFLGLYSILLESNHQLLVSEALTMFDILRNKVAPIVRELVYKAVAKYGSDEQIHELQSLRLAPINCIEEKNRLDVALAILSKRQQPPELGSGATHDSGNKRKRTE